MLRDKHLDEKLNSTAGTLWMGKLHRDRRCPVLPYMHFVAMVTKRVLKHGCRSLKIIGEGWHWTTERWVLGRYW